MAQRLFTRYVQIYCFDYYVLITTFPVFFSFITLFREKMYNKFQSCDPSDDMEMFQDFSNLLREFC